MEKGLPNLNSFEYIKSSSSMQSERKAPSEIKIPDSIEDNGQSVEFSSLLQGKIDNTDKWEILFRELLISDKLYETSEMEANGTNSVFIKSKGKRIEIEGIFDGEEDYNRQILKLVKKFRPDWTSNELPKYIAEGRLKLRNEFGQVVNTARCHIVLPPASDFPQVTIAKKTTSLTTLDIIQSSGSMDSKMRNFVHLCLACNLTTVLSGASGAGKTTFLEAMTKEWPMGIRVGVAEDSPELNLLQENTTYLKSAPLQPGMETKDAVSLDWCVQQLNRMRVDKIIVGETRSKEFFYFLQAANSGCEGSLTTIHADNPQLCLQKMTQFAVMAMPQPIRVANLNIASTVEIIIQLVRLLDGRYRVSQICEVSRTLGNDDNATISTVPLVTYDEKNDVWKDSFHTMTDNLRNKIEAYGYDSRTFKEKF